MKHKLILIIPVVVIILLALLWAGNYWRRRTVDCSQIEETALRSLDFKETDVREMLKWVASTYQVPKSSLSEYETMDGATGLNWQVSGNVYYARFYDDELRDVLVYWKGLEPSGKKIVECFGKPDLYYAEYTYAAEAFALVLDLWYPQKGIVVRGIHFFYGTEKKLLLDENVIMTDIRFLTPSSTEEMNSHIPPKGSPTEYPVTVLKPWPGWESIVIDNKMP